MFQFFANIFGYLLAFIYGFINNYGLAIIVFTIFIKILFIPFSVKQQRTMKKTAKIQEIKAEDAGVKLEEVKTEETEN